MELQHKQDGENNRLDCTLKGANTRLSGPVSRVVVLMKGLPMTMKTLLAILVLLAQCILANAEDFSVSSETTTNLTAGAWRRTEVYTRDGQEILLTERTSSLDGSTWALEQSIIWQGETAAMLTTVSIKTDVSHGIRFYAAQGVDAEASWNEVGAVRGVSLVGSNGEIRVGFTASDGVLTPLSARDTKAANAAQQDMRETFGRFIEKKTTGDQFLGEIEKLQKKHGTTKEHNQSAHGTR